MTELLDIESTNCVCGGGDVSHVIFLLELVARSHVRLGYAKACVAEYEPIHRLKFPLIVCLWRGLSLLKDVGSD